MIKKIFLLVKKFIFALLLIYAYNILVFPIKATIPLNVFSILFVTFFGFPAVIGFCLFQLLLF